jgi:uncharacterized membrane protein
MYLAFNPNLLAMEFLLFIAVILIIVLLFIIRGNQKELQKRNEQTFKSLKKDLLDLKEQLSQSREKEIIPSKEIPLKPTDEEVVQWRPAVPIQTPVEKSEEPQPISAPIQKETATVIVPSEKVRPRHDVVMPKESWWDKWVRNNPDFEKFVGENLANKIGIAVLVLGIGFFVKYAIDQNWIKEAGRVAIGIGCGVIMIGIAHYLRNTYRSFSSVMAGGGIAVFYFTIAFAFHEYSLFSQTTAFIIMVVITAFAVTLSLLYDKIELAVIAVIGGFLVPFLVSNGSGNYVVLFTYLLILNIGILCVSYFKKWPLLYIISFFFTLVIYGGWLIQQSMLSNHPLPYKNALLFASSFYIIFLFVVLVYNIRKQRPFKAFDFSLLMLITFSYYAQGIIILGEWNDGAYQGLFTIIMSVINLCLAWWLYVSNKGDKNLLYLLIGLTLTFLSLAAPVQLHGQSITMFWAAEAVLIYWLHQKSGISIFKYSSAIVLAMMLISLLMDWSIANEASTSHLPMMFTNWQGIVTNVVAIISLSLYSWLLYKKAEEDYVLSIRSRLAAVYIAVLAVLVTYLSCIFGVNLYFAIANNYDVPNVYHQLITYGFVALLLFILKKVKLFEIPLIEFALVFAAFGLYIFSSIAAYSLVDGVIAGKYAGKHLWMHWLAGIILLYLFFVIVKILRSKTTVINGAGWVINILLVLFFSIEFRHLYVTVLADAKNIFMYHAQYMKAGLTIVWAVYSFVIMWLGMKHKYKTLRIISLSLFTLALLKLFLFDIRNISAGGKIAAFIMLGVLLLVISFMYQRLKKIIIDNEEKSA